MPEVSGFYLVKRFGDPDFMIYLLPTRLKCIHFMGFRILQKKNWIKTRRNYGFFAPSAVVFVAKIGFVDGIPFNLDWIGMQFIALFC